MALEFERDMQRAVIRLYESVGCRVVRFSQTRATRQTPGIPDLKVYCPRKGVTWWMEVKAPGGKQEPEQQVFQALAEACGETYVLGGLEVALRQLERVGVVPILAPGLGGD